MITSKQRAFLRSVANTFEPICQIGKEGLSPMVLDSISKALDARELIKINVLQNCDEDTKFLIEEICEALDAQPVSRVGRKLVIYKANPKLKKHVLDQIV